MNSVLKLKNIKIKNYKSIKDTEVNLDGYGLYIFTGKNGVGKSNVINAFNSLTRNLTHKELQAVSYKNYVNKNNLNNEDVSIDYNFLVDANIDGLNQKGLLCFINFDKSIKDSFNIREFSFSRFINKDFDINNNPTLINTYKNLRVNEGFCKNNLTASNQAGTNIYDFSILEENSLNVNSNKLFSDILSKNLMEEVPNSFSWSYSTCESLFFNDIDLNNFINNDNSNIYLKGLLKKISNIDLKQCLRDKNGKRKLKNELDILINDYISSTWANSGLSIESDINDENILTFDILDGDIILDKETEISSGYKLILSFITSIFLSNNSELNKNNIIVIDEPELHLHPSAVKEIREMLLELSKNNYIIVSTHSPHMIKYDKKENNVKYFIVRKDIENGTIVEDIKDESLASDDLYEEAFGISFMSSLISENILIVEGEIDKKVIYKHLNNKLIKIIAMPNSEGHRDVNRFIRYIKSVTEDYNIKIVALFDSDNAGMKYYHSNKNIIKCFNLKEIIEELPKNAEIEDLYDISFIKNEFKPININYVYDENKSVLSNLELATTTHKYIIKDEWLKKIENSNKKFKKLNILANTLESEFKKMYEDK